MSRRTGTADLPLHGGRVPRWLADRMTRLGAVMSEAIVHHYGRDIMRQAWAGAIHVRPGGFSVGAYDRAIRAAGGSDFNRDFARFAVDVAEWRTDAVFPEGSLYQDAPRQGSLPLHGRGTRRTLNHTTFEMLRVHAPRGRALVVEAAAPRRDSAGVALVGRLGGELHGRVVSRLRFKRHGGRMSVRLARPGRFSRITAVLINADTTAIGFSARQFDWNYLTDTARFRARARLVR